MDHSFTINIYFDESGKNQVKPHLMGGLSIPSTYYEKPEIQELNDVIKRIAIHWTKYDGIVKKETLFGASSILLWMSIIC